ncbi:MAG: cysteine--1-D-myo-inosityl 2-amino-2-deoxy-alpha-D-glucopyranoside ligase, partial [Nocardioides sp.]|nr:cysteine--1-D-myo-inosityl 2-amino-2-deoxy-alpha-D-glucopyranoside ligase [Nocardioides sp.]
SLGNLVFVSALRNSDVDPMGIRLALLRHHYRSDWEWTDAELWDAVDTVAAWRKAISLGAGAPATPVVEEVLAALADDLDAPRATAAVDAWVAATLGTDGLADTSDPDAAVRILGLVDAALGLSL